MSVLRLLATLALVGASTLSAQQPATPAPPPPIRRPPTPATAPALRPAVGDTSIFAPLDLPPGDLVRRSTGKPGPAYWQQRVDYDIAATLDTAAKRLSGVVTVRYTNHSPDTLSHLWMQLDQNLFRDGSTGSLLNPPDSRFAAEGFQGGYDLDSVVQLPAAGRGAATAIPHYVDGTQMRLDLPAPVAPGGTTTFRLGYAFNVPEHGADRMGRDGPLYEMAQWYPRMDVYDDVRGWNTDPYLGQGEFYLEYGDITYAITLPAGYIMAGSGMLQNPETVLTRSQRARLAAALTSDTTIAIVTADELASGAARPRRTGTFTWKWKAENVRDVAWAASPEYQWDASGWDGILAQAFYRPTATLWKEAARMTRASIREYSTRWFRYPYPQITSVEGPVTGMEYPMLDMDGTDDSRQGLYSTATHEIGHNWFPMIVGSNERRYAWMDEGFNTFINTFAEEDYFQRSDSARRIGEAAFVLRNDQSPTAQPIITPANRYINNANLGSLAYIKPSVGLLTLRNKVLGPELFDAAFQAYIRRWAFRHPTPADFFRTMEDVSGRDLSWFWRGWFLTTAALDQAVEDVSQEYRSGYNLVRVTIGNHGQQVMPVEMRLSLADGTSQTVRLPVEIWYEGSRYTATVRTGSPVTAVMIAPDRMFPDVDYSNNGWTGGK